MARKKRKNKSRRELLILENPELLILENPEVIQKQADEEVQDAEGDFAELFDKMKDQISERVGFDITEDPKVEKKVDDQLRKLMAKITQKEIAG